MTEDQTKSGGKKRTIIAYGIIQLSATVVSALSLIVISAGIMKIAKPFYDCVEKASTKENIVSPVRYCNGGKK